MYSPGLFATSTPPYQPSSPMSLTELSTLTDVGVPGVRRSLPRKPVGRTVTFTVWVSLGSGSSALSATSGWPAATGWPAAFVCTQAPRAKLS